MLKLRWTFTNTNGLTQWYGNVDYYGQFVIGQWFALEAETGEKHWAGKFDRPTTICDCAYDVIVAYETRSDGPWTAGFGIYGIDAKTGELLWTNHGRGFWGRMLRSLDSVPGFTNEFRDVPNSVVGQHVLTESKRVLDIRTGRECPGVNLEPLDQRKPPERARQLYDEKSLWVGDLQITVDNAYKDFVIRCNDRDSADVWRFSSAEKEVHVDGNYYSYRLIDDRIVMILGDAPKTVPIKPDNSTYHRPNPANYSLGILDIGSGSFSVQALHNAEGLKECRIEAVRDSRLLVSADNRHLAEYEFVT